MTGWKSDMIELADFAFRRLRTRLVGLSDAEFFWEPVPGCWQPGDWSDGAWPAPFTTLGWRLTHVINNLNDPRYATQLGLEPRGRRGIAVPASAAEALDLLDAGWAVTRSYLQDLDESSLSKPLGPVAGPWADDDRGAFVLHMIDELVHHGAEIALMRDLYRAKQPPNPAIGVLLAGDRKAVDQLDRALIERARSEHPDLLLRAAATRNPRGVALLIELRFPIRLPDGTSALHHAAGAGAEAIIQQLLDAGADIDTRDGLYHATPSEWANYFGHTDLAEALRT